ASLLVLIPETGYYVPLMLLLSATLYFVTAVALRQQYAQAMVALLQSQSYRFLLAQSQDVDVLELGAMNSTVVQDLVAQLNDTSDAEYKLFLLQLLCETGSEDVLGIIRQLMNHAETDFQIKVLETYVNYGLLRREGRAFLLE